MSITISHPGMTPEFFDKAVHRAHCAGLVARQSASGRWIVNSSRLPTITYTVTREQCGCQGGASVGRCHHRALVLFLEWMQQRPAVALPHSDEAA